jgi:hypothetical protein
LIIYKKVKENAQIKKIEAPNIIAKVTNSVSTGAKSKKKIKKIIPAL